MKTHYSAKELAELGCVNGSSERNIKRLAQKENWLSRPRSGRGGGLEYAFDSLPVDVQAEIKAKQLRAMLPKVEKSSVPALVERDLGDLTRVQRATADARLLMALLVARFECELGGRTVAIRHVSDLSRNGVLPVIDGTDYNVVCATALAKKSKSGVKVGVGVRKLHEWCLLADVCDSAEQRLKMFAPQKQGQPEILPIYIDWLPDFLAVYRNTNGLNVAEAYRIFALSYQSKYPSGVVPSLAQVRNALD